LVAREQIGRAPERDALSDAARLAMEMVNGENQNEWGGEAE